MQTYLLAFLVSDFQMKSNSATKLPTDVLQQVVGRPYYISTGQADFALEAGIKILKSFEDHFDFEYPLPKIDQAGIPGFQSAMENWGLVT
jgi:aminopeptidase N